MRVFNSLSAEMNKKVLKNVVRLGQIFVETIKYCKSNNIELQIPPHLSDEYYQIENELRKDFILSPGMLIYIPEVIRNGSDNIHDTIGSLFQIVDVWAGIKEIGFDLDFEECEELYNEILNDGKIDVIGEMIERAKKIPPQFIEANPEILDFNKYFDQAVKAYVYDLNEAVIIIVCSFLETALKEKLENLKLDPAIDLRWEIDDKGNRKLIGVCTKFIDLIDRGYAEKIINKEDKDSLHEIRKIRNDVIHEGKTISAEQTLDFIKKMISIFENLFREDNK